MSVPLADFVSYLNEYLRIDQVPDAPDALNGLQVEGTSDIRRVAVAVDACLATIAGAALWGADLMIVHHGLFWGGRMPITGAQYRRFSALVRHRIGVYSAHLPLDVHPEVGNNATLAKALDLSVSGTFGMHQGVHVGVYGPMEIDRDELIEKVKHVLDVSIPLRVLEHGLWQTSRVGIVTGGGGTFVKEAAQAGIDTFITGEGPHYTALDAEEYGMNVIHAGHYATETLGVKALATHLEAQFGLETQFIDHPTGL
jgi:dinuclear metal center YbgI/SA1388 family protein